MHDVAGKSTVKLVGCQLPSTVHLASRFSLSSRCCIYCLIAHCIAFSFDLKDLVLYLFSQASNYYLVALGK